MSSIMWNAIVKKLKLESQLIIQAHLMQGAETGLIFPNHIPMSVSYIDTLYNQADIGPRQGTRNRP